MSEETGAGEEPKIIVDDDWKSQVEKEKEELKSQILGSIRRTCLNLVQVGKIKEILSDT